MKPLNSPWVTGGLVAVALLAVSCQLFSSGRGRSGAHRAQPAAAAAPPFLASAPTSASSGSPRSDSSKEKAASLAGVLDSNFISPRFADWAESGGRDPFLLYRPLNQPTTITNAPSQLSKWKLAGIWHQTGSRVAVINNGVYREGDAIEGYKIIRIDDDAVWFQNPDSLDHLEFRIRGAVAPGLAKGVKATTVPAIQPESEERH